MKKLFSNYLFLILIFLLPSQFLSCKKNEVQTKDHSKIIVGFSQIGAESAWRTCNTESIFQAAKKEGIQLIYSNAEQKQENQIKAIRSFIVYQVDVIVFVPIVQDGWDNVLREAKEANIPVIVIDRNIITSDENLYTGYIGTNFEEEGRNAARFLLQKFAGISKNFNILEISGTENSSAAVGRYNGFREVINTDNRFKIIHSQNGDFLRSKGKEILDNIILQNKKNSPNQNHITINQNKIDIIFSHNDGMTLGILDSLKNNNIASGKDLVIISIDAEQAAIDALKDRRINCVVECNPKIGPRVMKLIKTIHNKNTIPKKTFVEEVVFTEFDNLENIVPRGY